MSWATVTGGTNGNRPRSPGGEVYNPRPTNIHQEPDLDPNEYRKSPMRRNDITKSIRPIDNIRPKFMQNERDRGLQGNPNPNRGRDHYGRNNNYSPHASAALGREHSDKRGGFNKFQKYDDYPNSYNYQPTHNNYHDKQLGDSLFHQVEDPHAATQQHTQSHIQTKFQNTQVHADPLPIKQGGNEYVLPDRKDEETQARYKQQNNDDLWSGEPAKQTKWKSRRVEESKRQREQQQAQQQPPLTHEQQPQNPQIQPKKISLITAESAGREWWYTDPQNQIQGPFSEEEMRDWFHEKYFNTDLPVRCDPAAVFVKLGLWFEEGNRAFLAELPSEYIKSEVPEQTIVPQINEENLNTRNAHSPQNPQTNQISTSTIEPRTTKLSMNPLGSVMEEATQDTASHGQTQVGFSGSRVHHHQRFPGASTLDRNAPIFNPSERYQPPPVNQQQSTSFNTGMNPKNQLQPQQTSTTNDPTLFSTYRNQGFNQQHELQRQTPVPSAFEPTHNTIPTSHTRPGMVTGGRFDSNGPSNGLNMPPPSSFGNNNNPINNNTVVPNNPLIQNPNQSIQDSTTTIAPDSSLMPPKHAFGYNSPPTENNNIPSPNRHINDSVLPMNRFHHSAQHVSPTAHGQNLQSHPQHFYDQNSILSQTKQPKDPPAGPPSNKGPSSMMDMLDNQITEEESKKEPANPSAWNDIGITTTPTRGGNRQDSPLSSPFGNVGSSDYHHAGKKNESKGGWGRSTIDEVKKPSQPILHDEREEVQQMRRGNEHVQIQRNRSPPDRNNFPWNGMSGQSVNPNNHIQRNQQNQRVDKRMTNNATKPPMMNKKANDVMGGKPRPSPHAWGSSSNSSWDAGRPRIARNNNNNNLQNNRSSPNSRQNQWNSGNSKTNDEQSLQTNQSNKPSVNTPIVSANVKTNPNGNRTSQKSQMINQPRRIKERNTRKPLISKGDPTISSSVSSTKRTNNTSTKAKNSKQNSTESNSWGVKISRDFEEWCLKQLNEIQREQLDGRSLIHFLMTLNSSNEIKRYILTYLGDSKASREFADGFIQHKKFEDNVGESFQETKRRRKRRRRKNPQS